MLNERKRRIGENEVIFRDVNEQVNTLNASLPAEIGTMRVVCECGTRNCLDQITIPREEYARVREEPTLFITRPGHDFPETETVVSRANGYWIVRKDPGLPAAIALTSDPRD